LLLSIILSALYGFFLSGLTIWHRIQDKAEVEENLRIGMNRLSRELRQAENIISFTPDSGGKLTFTIPDRVRSGSFDRIGYHRSASGDAEKALQLIRSVNGSGNNPVARYINKLSVEPANCGPGTKLLTITLVGEKGQSGQVEVSTAVMLRKAD